MRKGIVVICVGPTGGKNFRTFDAAPGTAMQRVRDATGLHVAGYRIDRTDAEAAREYPVI